jgi:hypothetical protein
MSVALHCFHQRGDRRLEAQDANRVFAMKPGHLGELVKDLLLLIPICRPIPSGDRLD